MKHLHFAVLLGLSALSLCAIQPTEAHAASKRHVAVELIAESSTAVAGSNVTVAIHERIEPGWHTYWINPGDSGEPTSVVWQLPDGAVASPLQWAVPHTIPIAGLTNYGYETEVTLLADINVPANANGDFAISGKVTLLVCKDICVPEETEVSLTLPLSTSATASTNAAAIQKARLALPTPWPGDASYGVDTGRNVLTFSARSQPETFNGIKSARFFPLTWGVISNADPQNATIKAEQATLQLAQGDTKETPDRLDGLLVLTSANGERIGYVIAAKKGPNVAGIASPIEGGASFASTGVGGANTDDTSGLGVFGAILFAFAGGLILNLMPCVFPVLALKAFSFANARQDGRRSQGVAYLGGVLASFAGFAVLIAVLREGSAALGWGFQFQSPAFVLGLAILFLVMGLSLSGLMTFGSGIMSAGDGLTRKDGLSGTFFTGVLAAVAATPCTAPFMGAAIGFGMTQPVPVLFAILIALGLGFAAPVFALSASPSLQRLLPRPGAWMETLKQAMAFPLYATAAWLVWVLSLQTGSNGVLGAALAFVGVSFAAWLAGKTAFSSLPVKLLAPAAGAAAIAFGLSIGSVDGLEPSSALANTTSASLNEEPFSSAKLASLRAEGKPVFLNMTAAWCITCKVNERVALKSSAIASAFQANGITYLKGDWTKQNPEITALLQGFGRAGVPLYVFYPGGGGEPRVLPQFLTEGVVLDEIKTKSATPLPKTKGA